MSIKENEGQYQRVESSTLRTRFDPASVDNTAQPPEVICESITDRVELLPSKFAERTPP